jgi:thiamine-monophosphate kinase
MIDLSDGIAADAAHIARASGLELRVEVSSLPLAEGLGELSAELGEPPWRLAAAGGEDYELCFCVAPADRARVEDLLRESGGAEVTWIGQVLAGTPGVSFLDEHADEHRLEGFEHRW